MDKSLDANVESHGEQPKSTLDGPHWKIVLVYGPMWQDAATSCLLELRDVLRKLEGK